MMWWGSYAISFARLASGKRNGKKRKSRFLSAEMGQILASQPGDKNRRLLYRVNIKPHEGQRRKGGGGWNKKWRRGEGMRWKGRRWGRWKGDEERMWRKRSAKELTELIGWCASCVCVCLYSEWSISRSTTAAQSELNISVFNMRPAIFTRVLTFYHV